MKKKLNKCLWTLIGITALTLIMGICLKNKGMDMATNVSKGKETIPASKEAKYFGNKTTGKFHHPSCRFAGIIEPEHRIQFFNREAAMKLSFIPCKVCKP